MDVWHWILIVELVIGALMMVYRGVAGIAKEYDAPEVIFGLAEIAFLIWIVVVKL